jgi:phosphohistidine phosphatase SixA
VPPIIATLLLALAVSALDAQGLSGQPLVVALRSGGCVIVMRHASSPRDVPTKEKADPDNVKLERQLDDAGRASAIAMGKALRDLKIPIGEVFTSPTYRAMQTVRLAQLPNPRAQEELGDSGQSMQGASDAQAAWLREKVSHAATGTNTVIVTHMPNIARAFPEWGAVADGEAVVLRPDGKGGAFVLGRMKIDAWPRLR